MAALESSNCLEEQEGVDVMGRSSQYRLSDESSTWPQPGHSYSSVCSKNTTGVRWEGGREVEEHSGKGSPKREGMKRLCLLGAFDVVKGGFCQAGRSQCCREHGW